LRSCWRIGLLTICAGWSAWAHGEAFRRDFFFQTIGAEQGLAQNSVAAILQDRNGFIWIGTASGLQKYDGYGFKNYEHSGDGPAGPPEGPVTAMAEDADGNLWVGTAAAGLVRRNAADGRFHRVSLAADAAPGTSGVHTLLFDPQRGLWVGSDAGVALVDVPSGRAGSAFPLPAAKDSSRPPRLRQLRLGGDGTLWIASSAGLYRLAADAEAVERVAADRIDDARALLAETDGQLDIATADGLYTLAADGHAERLWPAEGKRSITALARDGHGRFWLAVPHEGVALFDPADGSTQWLRPGGDVAGSLPEATISNFELDRSGLLWIGTLERGVTKVDPQGTLFRYVVDRNPARERTASNYIRAIAEAPDGALWIGTDGDGLKRYDAAANRFDYYTDLLLQGLGHDARMARLFVNAVSDAGDGRLWVATNRGVALLDPAHRTAEFLPLDPSGAHGIPDTDVRSLLRARDGALWIGTTFAGVVRYDPAQHSWSGYRHDTSATAMGGLADDRISVLYEDHEGRVWAGGRGGLNLIDPTQRSVRVFRNDPADPHSLVANFVRSIQQSDDGALWIGTQAGLCRLDKLDEQRAYFTRWLPRDGLPSGTVYAIADDHLGRLWLSTNRGIAAFDRKTATFRAFTATDGLQGMEFNGGAFTAMRDGGLAFGGVNGLNLFSPRAVVGSRYAAPIVFTDVRVGDRGIRIPAGGGELRIAASDRIVNFGFAALDFAAPELNRFAYRLEGFDGRWIDAGTRHDATYTNLAPGHYAFEVRASNHDGYWNERAARIDLQVTPPWWDSPAAWTAYLLAVAAAALLWWHALRQRRIEERAYHRDLREREDRLRLALWGSGDAFWDWNIPNGLLTVIGASAPSSDTSPAPRVLSTAWFREHLHPDDLPAVERRLEQHIDQISDTFESEHRLLNGRGEWGWAMARGRIVERDTDGQPLRMCGTARDVTASRAAERDRRIAQEVIRSMNEAVAVCDLEFRFLTVNPAFTRIAGWREDEVAGRSTSLLNCSQHSAEHYLAMREQLTRTGHWRGELWQRRKDGDEFLSWAEISEVRDADGVRTQFVSVISDITDRKRTEQELRYLANYDALTGLPNRTMVSERIGHAIIRARRGGHRVAVLFLDLDRFKHVNDSMGHAAGDRMLKAAGSRLRQVVREGDSVARLGGDEFTVVLEDVASRAEAERVAEKIIAAFEQPLELDNGQEVVISPSIGISLYPDHGQVPTDLLKFADTAMYQAKEHGRKTWMVYTEAMDAAARLRATTVAALRKALERNELSLVYQPKLSLLDERITGVEALLRWRSGDLGNVSPGVFIPIAEETGMIIEIGDWVVEEACAQLARWRDAGMRDVTMSINVSVAQLLRGDLIQRLCDVLAEHDIAPNQIELELTESMVMANAEQSITTLRRLKAIGVTLAIDDFGTGYSSLSYLKRLPIDTLKIDKEFVGDITTDPDDEAITATVIAMAHSLGLNVVAEGVESAEQVEYLREQDCDEVQGHWLAFPLPPEQCLSFLQERARQRRIALGEPHH
jgi:diguanylate cyclase (GGDEF)-like protein/PAS domain S-box-containing protein